MIRTPNDIYAASTTSLYVTNDHFYRTGTRKLIEDISGASWTDTLHIELSSDPDVQDDTHGITTTIATQKIHNNNGLGHGATPDEIMLVDSAGGVLVLATPDPAPLLKIRDTIQYGVPNIHLPIFCLFFT